MNKIKCSRSKVYLLIVLAVILILTITINLALYKNEKKSLTSSNNYFYSIVSSTALNKETNISLQDLNKLLITLSHQEMYLEYSNDRDSLKIIIPTTYNGIDIDVVANAEVCLTNENFEILLTNIKIGKLPIPSNIATNILRSNIPENISVSKNKIIIPSSLKIKIQGHDLNIRVSQFKIYNDHVTIKITGGVESVVSIIKNEVSAILSNKSKT